MKKDKLLVFPGEPVLRGNAILKSVQANDLFTFQMFLNQFSNNKINVIGRADKVNPSPKAQNLQL